ncbi:MAG: YcaO-like family protein, partial [Catenulispora sp.]|nr:YcaO-like family protein [Catenulispora sp.]
GLTYAVSMGMGVSAAHARVGAVMESIESWHAENLRLPVAARGPAAGLGIGYDVRGLNLAPRSPLSASVVLDWARGHTLLTGRETLAPIDGIRLDGTAPRDWASVLFRPTSEGLATGNTETEAALHGLLELVERAALAGYRAARRAGAQGAPPRFVDPETCRDPVTRRIYEAVRDAGCTVRVRDVGGPTGLPCFLATVWSAEMPIRCVGHACHVRSELALGRALGEAVLTRLAAISGARDDIDGVVYREMAEPERPAAPADVRDFDRGDLADDGDLDSVLRHCAALVAGVTGVEPLVVRLTHDDVGIPAVKVVAPGLRNAAQTTTTGAR